MFFPLHAHARTQTHSSVNIGHSMFNKTQKRHSEIKHLPFTRTRTHTYTHTWAHTWTQTRTHAHTNKHTHTHARTNTYTRTHIHTPHAHTHTHTHTYSRTRPVSQTTQDTAAWAVFQCTLQDAGGVALLRFHTHTHIYIHSHVHAHIHHTRTQTHMYTHVLPLFFIQNGVRQNELSFNALCDAGSVFYGLVQILKSQLYSYHI